VGLAAEEEGAALSEHLAEAVFREAHGDSEPVYALEAPVRGERQVLELAAWDSRTSRPLEIRYAGEGAGEPTARTIDPYQICAFQGRSYVAAWCRLSRGWRRFPADRVIEVRLGEGEFPLRDDFSPVETPADLFQEPAEGVEDVQVRFSPRVARWVRERYGDAEEQEDGSVAVLYRTASPEWLVRQILQYGPEAEVVAPQGYREATRAAVA
jgi:proteasome accessory factor C